MMSTATTLCAEIVKSNMSVSVDGIIIHKRSGKSKAKGSGKVALNFVVKDIVGDTANVVYWERPEELLKIDSVLGLGNAYRFSALKSVNSPRSQSMNPKVSCPYVLQMDRWSVENLPEGTAQKLMEIFHSVPQELDLTPISELLSASESCKVNLMAVVVAVGEQRQVALWRGETAMALDMEVADSSRNSIVVTLWDAELSVFIKEQIIAWDSVVYLQDANLKCPSDRLNYLSTNYQTLITPNVTGKSAIMIQRAVERARANGFQPRKIHEVPRNAPMYSPDLPPQWVTFKVISDFFNQGVWSPDSNPYKPLASILLVSKIGPITFRMVCPYCDTVMILPPQQGGQTASTKSACRGCELYLWAECREASVRATFCDMNGGMEFVLNNTDIQNMLDGLPNGVVEKSSVECLLEKQMLRRFVLVFQILNLDGEERPLTLRTIRVRKPAPEDWITYRQVALSKPMQ